VLDVGHQLLGQLQLVGAGLHPGALEAADPALVEHGAHGDDALELTGDGGQVTVLEHAGGAGGLEGVGRDRVPRAEHDVVERGQRHEVLDHRVAALVALAQADVGHLGHGPDGRRALRAGGEDTGHEGGGDGAESGSEDPEAAGSGGDGARGGHAGKRNHL
jgi:hypothetical protein